MSGSFASFTGSFSPKKTVFVMSLRQCEKCHLDVSDIVRIKCAVCADVELCVECFAEGAELDSHKKEHPFSLIVLLLLLLLLVLLLSAEHYIGI